MAVNLGIEPYYDDFIQQNADGKSPFEQYYKILFRPGHAVQARELTQLQSILQDQVSRFGAHVFNEGAMVIPGAFTIQPNVPYVVLTSTSVTPDTSWAGLTVTGASSGVVGTVYAIAPAEGSDPVTLWVNYTNSGDTKTVKTFAENETLNFSNGETATVGQTEVNTRPPMGFSTHAKVERGVYYVKNSFVLCYAQSWVIDKYNAFRSSDIGFNVIYEIVTPSQDPTLNDNANGSLNYAAPGAHRLKIQLDLVHQPLNAAPGDEVYYKEFIRLGQIDESGNVVYESTGTDYSVLMETMARRTYDESGDYTIRPFKALIKNHTDVYTPGDSDLLVAAIEESKAYVKGYEIQKYGTSFVEFLRARQYDIFEAASVNVSIGNSIRVTIDDGLPQIDTFDILEIRDASLNVVATARVRSIVARGGSPVQYDLYLFDIIRDAAYKFDDARTVYSAGAVPFNATIVLDALSGNAVIDTSRPNTMVHKLPFDRVRTLDTQIDDNATDDFDYVYFLNRRFSAQTYSTTTGVTFTTIGGADASELFEPFDASNWMAVVASLDGSSQGVPVDHSSVSRSSHLLTNSRLR